MSLAAAILLGIVQGLTEFLPVSSSAHLILARAFFGWDVPADFGLAFDVALHIGTLAAILAFFRREIAAMVAAIPSLLSPAAGVPGDPARLAQRIVAGTVPVVVVGLLFNDFIEETLRTPARRGRGPGVGAALMFAAERLGTNRRAEDTVTWLDAVLIGCAQAVGADSRRLAIGRDDQPGTAARIAARRRRPLHVPPGDPRDAGRRRQGVARARSHGRLGRRTRS